MCVCVCVCVGGWVGGVGVWLGEGGCRRWIDAGDNQDKGGLIGRC